MKTALIAGSTGLIGKQLLDLLLDHDQYSRVIAISRKPLASTHPKLVNVFTSFDTLANHAANLRADDVFCCLGTTIRQAGSEKAFREVDHDYPLQLARITKESGATRFLLVTALGANAQSSVFYNRVKGEVENAITSIGFESYHIFRPSLLLGPRSESRSGEDAAKIFFKVFGFLVPKKYKAIDSRKVAQAMLHFAGEPASGKFIHESAELQGF